MKVFVDIPADRGWRLGPNAHLMPWDGTESSLQWLHRTAQTLGLKREWFQEGCWPHYDLSIKRYKGALRLPQVQLITTRGYIVFRRVLPAGMFVEPGTGLPMKLDQWYVVSDSGSIYVSKSFPTPGKAAAWLRQNNGPGKEDTVVWRPKNPANGFTDPRCANIVRGLDMLLFWAANDSFALSQSNLRKS